MLACTEDSAYLCDLEEIILESESANNLLPNLAAKNNNNSLSHCCKSNTFQRRVCTTRLKSRSCKINPSQDPLEDWYRYILGGNQKRTSG